MCVEIEFEQFHTKHTTSFFLDKNSNIRQNLFKNKKKIGYNLISTFVNFLMQIFKMLMFKNKMTTGSMFNKMNDNEHRRKSMLMCHKIKQGSKGI